jgi:hypothetical protein
MGWHSLVGYLNQEGLSSTRYLFMKITTTQRLWIKLFRGDRLEPHGSTFIIMFLNKLKVIGDKQFYDEKDRMMNTVYRWDIYDKVNRSNKKR